MTRTLALGVWVMLLLPLIMLVIVVFGLGEAAAVTSRLVRSPDRAAN